MTENEQALNNLLMTACTIKAIEKAREETINKAVEWLKNQGAESNNGVVMISIDDFKKAMEE